MIPRRRRADSNAEPSHPAIPRMGRSPFSRRRDGRMRMGGSAGKARGNFFGTGAGKKILRPEPYLAIRGRTCVIDEPPTDPNTHPP